jgi:hypothetical protein
MKKWMNRLAEKHESLRQTHPDDDVVVVFDIDDTILDLRHMVQHVLQSFDRRHDTRHFHGLTLQSIDITEADIRRMTGELQIPAGESRRVWEWLNQHYWSPAVVRDAHRPFPGAMGVIRWLQDQPRTFVGLNTGRPETIRHDTLACLREIGRPHGVTFADGLLFMSRYNWGERIAESKVEGIRYFRDKGFRVAAFVDNEPDNLKAVSDFDREGEILLLHADTVFTSSREIIPHQAVSGNIYDVRELARSATDTTRFGRAA